MELFEVIARRHSYRGPYKDDPVPRVDLERIVQAGIQAPSGYNVQTTRFVIVDDPQVLRRISALNPQSQVLNTAKAIIACVAPQGPDPDSERLFFGVEDCAAAVENMLLAITALGYAGVWLDGWLRQKGHDQQVGEILGVPEGYVVRVLLPIGVPAEPGKQREKLPFYERAWFNRWSGA